MTQVVPQAPVPDNSTKPTAAATVPAPRRWRGRLLMLFVLALAVTVWFAPLIVAQTALKQQVPKLLFPTYPGTVELGDASLDWLRPVVVHDLKATDADGKPLLAVKEFATTLPLWKLAVSQADLGRLILTEPQVSVELRSDGSNVEDVLTKFLAGPASSAPPSDFELEVNDATIDLEHKDAVVSSSLKPLSLLLTFRKGTVEDVEVTIGNIPAKDAPSLTPASDWLAFRYGSEPTQDGVAMTPGSKHIRLKAESWTLDKLQPALARFEPNAQISGIVNADARSQVTMASTGDWTRREWSWDGRITLEKLVLDKLQALKQDRVALESTSLSGRIAAQQGRLSMDRLQLQTEVAELTATGDIPMAGLESASPVNTLQSILGEQDYTIHAHLDLQRLAKLLPNTLRVREGTQITSGRIDVNLKSEELNGARTWTSNATVDRLAATNQGHSVTWNEPLTLNLQAHRDKDVITVDQATCQSDFFKLTGSGSLTDAKFNATGDLTRLEENLQRFIDLGLDNLAGKLRIQGEIRRDDGDQVMLTTAIQLDDFQWTIARDTVWQESRLVLGVHAAGSADGSNLRKIETADLKLTSGPDTLVCVLQKPLDLADTATWSIKSTLNGNLQTWQNRLRPFVSFSGWQMAGLAKIDAAVTSDPKQIEVVSLAGEIGNLDVRGPEWWIKEPQVKLETTGVWSNGKREWTSPATTVTGSALACRVHDLVVGLKADGQLERITGDAAYRGDLDRLSRWKNQAVQMPKYTMLGTVEGRAHLVERDNVISIDMDTTVTKFIFADLETLANNELHWVALWREPELHLNTKGSYDITKDLVQMETASVQADGLNVNVHGSLGQLTTKQLLDVQGELGYDWTVVSERLGDKLKKRVQLTGKQTRPIALKGSLASLSSPTGGLADLTGSLGIGFDSAIVEGLAVGPTDVSAKLDQGICQFAPISTTVADGRLHLTPQLQLNRNPMLLVLPAEKVIDQVQITPEICNSWMKYVTPLLADSTQIDGKFSLDLTGGAVPLSAPMNGELGGTMGVHHVKVRPAGMALQVSAVVDQIKSIIQKKPAGGPKEEVWMQMPEQGIPFKLTGGRVYHQNVTFAIGEAIMQSTGSVGADETIDLTLQVPIQDDWVKDQKVLAGLKGKALRVPLRGTLTRPQIDSRVLTELATQIGGTALEGAIENKLDDLFKKKLGKFLPGQD